MFKALKTKSQWCWQSFLTGNLLIKFVECFSHLWAYKQTDLRKKNKNFGVSNFKECFRVNIFRHTQTIHISLREKKLLLRWKSEEMCVKIFKQPDNLFLSCWNISCSHLQLLVDETFLKFHQRRVSSLRDMKMLWNAVSPLGKY